MWVEDIIRLPSSINLFVSMIFDSMPVLNHSSHKSSNKSTPHLGCSKSTSMAKLAENPLVESNASKKVHRYAYSDSESAPVRLVTQTQGLFCINCCNHSCGNIEHYWVLEAKWTKRQTLTLLHSFLAVFVYLSFGTWTFTAIELPAETKQLTSLKAKVENEAKWLTEDLISSIIVSFCPGAMNDSCESMINMSEMHNKTFNMVWIVKSPKAPSN